MAKPTLLVVDVQKAWDDPVFGQRNNDPSAEENVARLLKAWRTAEAPIIHVRHRETDPDWPMLHEGNPGFEFMDEAVPQEGSGGTAAQYGRDDRGDRRVHHRPLRFDHGSDVWESRV